MPELIAKVKSNREGFMADAVEYLYLQLDMVAENPNITADDYVRAIIAHYQAIDIIEAAAKAKVN